MYDVGGKFLSGIKSMYVGSSTRVRVNRVKWGKSEWFRIESGVRKGCIVSPWFFNVYMDALMKEYLGP